MSYRTHPGYGLCVPYRTRPWFFVYWLRVARKAAQWFSLYNDGRTLVRSWAGLSTGIPGSCCAKSSSKAPSMTCFLHRDIFPFHVSYQVYAMWKEATPALPPPPHTSLAYLLPFPWPNFPAVASPRCRRRRLRPPPSAALPRCLAARTRGVSTNCQGRRR